MCAILWATLLYTCDGVMTDTIRHVNNGMFVKYFVSSYFSSYFIFLSFLENKYKTRTHVRVSEIARHVRRLKFIYFYANNLQVATATASAYTRKRLNLTGSEVLNAIT